MTKKILLILPVMAGALALALVAPAAHAQTAPVKPVVIKFGKPEPADFEAKSFVADSAAPAVVLYDGGSARFRLNGNSFQMESDRTTRIKILKKAGYDVATVEVPLYHKNAAEEKMVGLRGFTYNEVGGKIEKVKLDIGQVFTEERTKNERVRKFTLPGVHEGSVIEYSYTITSDFLTNFQDWTFQREIPTRWSEFQATIPEYFDYKMLMQGYEPLALQTKEVTAAQYNLHTEGTATTPMTEHTAASNEIITAQATNYHWAMQNVPALRDEPYMTTARDYVARLNFELAGERMPGGNYENVIGTWEKINRELFLSDEFGVQLDKVGFLAATLKPLATQYPDPTARAAAVRELVLKAMKYDGSARFMASGPLKRSYELHRGTSADVNLLYIAALRQAGLAAQPVILSTRAHGRVNEHFPLLEQFNYVIGVLPLEGDKELLLDATDPLLPVGVLPTRCLNQLGRLVAADGGAGRWVSLAPSQRHNHFQDIKMTVDAQGNLSGQVRDESGGYTGAAVREKLQELGEKKYVTELASQHPGWELPSYKFSEVAEVSQPLRLSYELRQPASTAGMAQELYIKPLEAFGEGSNPFRHEHRNYPVDFGAPSQEVIMLTLTLPAGYTAELPKPAIIELPEQGGRYVYAASSPAPGTVQLLSRLILNKPVYGAAEYASLREFYRLALAKQAEAVVLRKQ